MTNTSPAVSVIIPCHNLGAFLDEAVESVLRQTFDDFEIIIIDDGSTDPATQHLFASYARPKARVIRTENQGLARTRNLGVAEARGRYITCLDADDMFEPTFIERTVAVLEGDARLAFASVWLRGFGELEFDWNPTTPEFPDLLLEDTVCTAALMRREAILAVGGYDPDMPVSGYEDWDLAIGLVEHGNLGSIVPEFLFRYRIRWRESVTSSCTAPANQAALMRYIVGKHPEPYRRHLPELLIAIEEKCLAMERYPTVSRSADPEDARRLAIDVGVLDSVLRSTSWRTTRPLRRLVSTIRRFSRPKLPSRAASRLSIVVTCCDQGVDVMSAIGSLHGLGSEDEAIIVDHGSSDPTTLQILDGYESAGTRVLRTGPSHQVEARAAGLLMASGRYLFAMGPEQTLSPGFLQGALEILEGENDAEFVLGSLRDRDLDGFTWPSKCVEDGAFAACLRVPCPVVRRSALEGAGGYDTRLASVELADADLTVRLAENGAKGASMEAVVDHHRRRQVPGRDDGRPFAPIIGELLRRNPEFFKERWFEVFVALEDQRRLLHALMVDARLPWKDRSAEVDWGTLRRVQPVSGVWGIDRGLPVDRYYIHGFLDRFRTDIQGRVLEVKDAHYTRAFGTGVNSYDVVDIAPNNPDATIIADLGKEDSLPSCSFDCFVLTQTLQFIYPLREALRNAHQALKPGGVLLATVPCVSRVDYEAGVAGDYWRVTEASTRRLFEEAFPGGSVEIFAHGNVLACCAFLMGLATEELTAAELDHSDRYFPLILCARAVKAVVSTVSEARAVVGTSRSRGAILLYHSISRRPRDRWGLAVSPDRFDDHTERLSRRFTPVPLTQLAAQVAAGCLRHGAVAVTFDDGYLDNLLVAMPVLRRWGVPATFFISGEDACEGQTFWWEDLDLRAEGSGMDDRSFHELHALLMSAAVEERSQMLSELAAAAGTPPLRLAERHVRELAAEPLAEIGGHGWGHRALGGLREEEQRVEIRRSLESLERQTGRRPGLFAYPFGGPFDETTMRILRESGVFAAVSVRREAVTHGSNLLDLPRLEVGDWSGGELEERLGELIMT